MLTETKFIDVDAIASKSKLTIDSAKAVDPVDVDAIASKSKLTIDSAKAVDPVDVTSTVLTVPAVKSTVVITSAFATPMVSASARTVTGSKCFILSSIRITAFSHKSITRKRVRLRKS